MWYERKNIFGVAWIRRSHPMAALYLKFRFIKLKGLGTIFFWACDGDYQEVKEYGSILLEDSRDLQVCWV